MLPRVTAEAEGGAAGGTHATVRRARAGFRLRRGGRGVTPRGRQAHNGGGGAAHATAGARRACGAVRGPAPSGSGAGQRGGHYCRAGGGAGVPRPPMVVALSAEGSAAAVELAAADWAALYDGAQTAQRLNEGRIWARVQ
eukprot:6197612-Pleurochrysis_carterae.AAC.1